MTQDDRWMMRYQDVVSFIETHHRNPSKYRIEEHDYLNWLKANRKALNAGKKVIAVTRLEKYGEHINDHQIQNNEAFAQNGYVVAVFEMDELGKAFEAFYNGTDGTRPWVNNDPLSIVKMIDQFIQENDKNTES